MHFLCFALIAALQSRFIPVLTPGNQPLKKEAPSIVRLAVVEDRRNDTSKRKAITIREAVRMSIKRYLKF